MFGFNREKNPTVSFLLSPEELHSSVLIKQLSAHSYMLERKKIKTGA